MQCGAEGAFGGVALRIRENGEKEVAPAGYDPRVLDLDTFVGIVAHVPVRVPERKIGTDFGEGAFTVGVRRELKNADLVVAAAGERTEDQMLLVQREVQ